MHKLNGASRTGYTFLGWNTEKDGSGEYVEYLYGVDETLYLYAVFEPKEYVIRYIFEGAYEGEETNPNTVVYGESVTLLPLNCTGMNLSAGTTRKRAAIKSASSMRAIFSPSRRCMRVLSLSNSN